MKSRIRIGFCTSVCLTWTGFYQRLNRFSAIYFTSYPKGCKLLKINSSFRNEAKNENFYLHPFLQIKILSGINNNK